MFLQAATTKSLKRERGRDRTMKLTEVLATIFLCDEDFSIFVIILNMKKKQRRIQDLN